MKNDHATVKAALAAATATNRAVEDAFAEVHGHKITGRDLKVLMILLKGDATRKEIEEATGLDKSAVKKAFKRLRDQLGVVKGGGQSAPGGGGRSAPTGGRSAPPRYGVAERDKLLKYIENVLSRRSDRGRSAPTMSEPLFPSINNEKKKKSSNKKPAPVEDNPAFAGNPTFSQEQALEQFSGLTVKGKNDQAALKAWRADPGLLYKRELKCWQHMCPAYHRLAPSPAERNRLFEARYNDARKAAGRTTSVKRGSPAWRGNLILARQLADELGLPYEIFIEAVRQKYAKLHHDGVISFAFPSPQHLKFGEKGTAQEAFINFEEKLIADRETWVLAMVPPFDPFDLGDPVHLEHCRWVWEKIVAACKCEADQYFGNGLSRATRYIIDALDKKLLPKDAITHSTVGMPLYVQAAVLNELDRRRVIAEADARGETADIKLPGTDRFRVKNVEELPRLGEEGKHYRVFSEDDTSRLVELLDAPAVASAGSSKEKTDVVGQGGGAGDDKRPDAPLGLSPAPAAQPGAPTCFGTDDCANPDCPHEDACLRELQRLRKTARAKRTEKTEAAEALSLEDVEAQMGVLLAGGHEAPVAGKSMTVEELEALLKEAIQEEPNSTQTMKANEGDHHEQS